MDALTPRDIDRMTREMVKRFAEVDGTAGYDLASATMGQIMAEYPPAVGWNYVLRCMSQVIGGDFAVRSIGTERR